MNWLAALDANGTRTVLVACSPAIVAQINLVKNFTGNGAVKSFQVPYHCRECDEEKVVLVETAEMSGAGRGAADVSVRARAAARWTSTRCPSRTSRSSATGGAERARARLEARSSSRR